VAAAVIGGLITGGGFALASRANKTIHGCVNNATHVLMVQRKCPGGTTRLLWSEQGPRGPQGLQGRQGQVGATGLTGPPGEVPWTIDWGEVGGAPASGSAPARCGVSGTGLGGCTYLAVGQYQVTATGCTRPAGSTNVLVQATPETGAEFQSDPDLLVHAEISQLGSVASGETVTVNVALLGTTGQGAPANPAPVDGSLEVTVYC
jgi:hypothetical protein